MPDKLPTTRLNINRKGRSLRLLTILPMSVEEPNCSGVLENGFSTNRARRDSVLINATQATATRASKPAPLLNYIPVQRDKNSFHTSVSVIYFIFVMLCLTVPLSSG